MPKKSSRVLPIKKPLKRGVKSFYVIGAFLLGLASVGIALILPNDAKKFCANSETCVHNLQAEVNNNEPAYFEGQEFIPPQINLAEKPTPSKVLGVSDAAGEKRIFVDLSTQTLYAYQGPTKIMETLVSTGKWNKTPPGDYKIWIKIRSQRMAGGEGADAYNLPNVPYIMFFYNDKVPKSDGYSLHGAYWHNNFGHMMSHGCVNMRTIDAEALYNWADPVTKSASTLANSENPGTAVTICNQVHIAEGAAPTCAD